MKKMLFVSAFALFGTFAMANEINTCSAVKNDCGIALIICWNGEADPDKLKEAAKKACEEEQEAPSE